jgi:hypothetical protein
VTILIESLKTRIFTSPKVMGTSLKHLAYKLDNGFEFQKFKAGGMHYTIHKLYPLQALDSRQLEEPLMKIAIIRDPVDRFLSLYKHRVLIRREQTARQFDAAERQGLNAMPSIDEFASKLDTYKELIPDIRHHSAPQSLFLGLSLKPFQFVFEPSDSSSLSELLSWHSGTQVLIPHFHKTSPSHEIQLSSQVLSTVQNHYAEDFDLLEEARAVGGNKGG